jgi:hypothetical protein
MFEIKKDIQAMTTFRRNPAKFLKHLKKTRRPLILTINGKAEAVVQDAEAYQRLLDIAAQADASELIRQGLEDVKKRPRTPGARSPGNAPERPCHTSSGLLIVLNRLRPGSKNFPRRFIVWSNIPTVERSFQKIRNFAICFLAVNQTFFTFAPARGLRFQLNEWFVFPEYQTFINTQSRSKPTHPTTSPYTATAYPFQSDT